LNISGKFDQLSCQRWSSLEGPIPPCTLSAGGILELAVLLDSGQDISMALLPTDSDRDGRSSRTTWLGWCLYDWANSAFATVILAAILPVYFVSLVPDEGASLPLVGHTVTASVLWSYSVSLSMLLVALSAPYIGSLGDRKRAHLKLLGVFCLLGALATCLLSLAGPGRYLLAAGLFIVANFGFAGANIFYNAFLPALAKTEADLHRLSAFGFALGYVGGGLALLLVVILVMKHQLFGFASMGAATRVGFLITGGWWALFAIPALLALRATPPTGRGTAMPRGLKGYLRIFAEIKAYPELLLFLIAFLFYNDGIQTVIAISAVFAKDILKLPTPAIIGCLLMVQFVAMPGALLFGKLARLLGAKTAVILALILFICVTGYASIIHTSTEFWILGFFVAIILGGSQAASRSIFGSLIPAGRNAEFFGFYALSSKFASIFGPFIFAFIADLTGSHRLSILALNLFFVVGIVCLLFVNVQKGQQRATTLQGTGSPKDTRCNNLRS
jgi:UMF1 family MFS transporter